MSRYDKISLTTGDLVDSSSKTYDSEWNQIYYAAYSPTVGVRYRFFINESDLKGFVDIDRLDPLQKLILLPDELHEPEPVSGT